jgi:hypothetical protein
MEPAFPNTPWSLIAEAAASGGERAAPLRQLLERYWQPVHRAIHLGWKIPEPRARDLVSAFLRRMLDPALLAALDPAQVRFRDLLKAKLIEFMANAAHALDARESAPPFELAEMANLPPSSGDPAAVFDEQWVLLVIHRALERLRQATAAKQPHVHAVFDAWDVRGERPADAELARRLGIDAEAVQPALQRARLLFRRFAAEEVQQYSGEHASAREELKWLLR